MSTRVNHRIFERKKIESSANDELRRKNVYIQITESKMRLKKNKRNQQ